MFSCFSCISSTKAVITNDISNIEQSTPIIDVSNVPAVPSRNILYYFKILKEPEPVSTTPLEDSKSENKASKSDEEEICLILQDKPEDCLPPLIITPIHDETQELDKTPVPKLDVQ
jgi:hypothetical protein